MNINEPPAPTVAVIVAPVPTESDTPIDTVPKSWLYPEPNVRSSKYLNAYGDPPPLYMWGIVLGPTKVLNIVGDTICVMSVDWS